MCEAWISISGDIYRKKERKEERDEKGGNKEREIKWKYFSLLIAYIFKFILVV